MTESKQRYLRWWRDRARPVAVTGLLIYSIGFFMDWVFGLEAGWILRWLGGAVILVGAGAGLLWLLDDEASG